MRLGARIDDRLKAISMTQAELARRVGVSQSTMNSLVCGNSRTTRSLLKIAHELETTPAYLMGETDDPKGGIELDAYSSEERDFVDLIRHLTPGDRKTVMALMKSLAQTGTGSVNSPKLTYRAGD